MDGGGGSLHVSLGVASGTGRRERNEDFAAACLGTATERARTGIAAAISDGIGGARGGREAAETMVRGFLDAYYDMPETLGVQRAVSQVAAALNRWIVAIGRTDPGLGGMGCTFSGLVLRGRAAHVFHVGDTRLYRLAGDRLTRLTEDHTLGQAGLRHVLYRAVGIEETLRLDYARHPVAVHDRFLLCSDGVHGVLRDPVIAAILGRRAAPDETARELVAEALVAGGEDNATALIMDVTGLPPPDQAGLQDAIGALPVGEMPEPGDRIDGFRLERVLSDGRYSRLFLALDEADRERIVLKFPQPRVAAEASCKGAFLREAWIGARLRSPWLGSVMELPPGRQSRLYTLMPYYDGESLEARLRRAPRPDLDEGLRIAIPLGKAVTALHRAGIIHRDIKPENVILEKSGSLKLVDLGVARIPGMEDFPAADTPGTPSYMAPEMFAGEAGSERTDLFALGVTVFRLFTGTYPYGEVEPFSHPRFGRPLPLTRLRPDLPAWLEAAIDRAIAADPEERHADMLEFVLELESGPRAPPAGLRRKLPLYQRNPLLFWQGLSAILAATLAAVLIRH